MLSRVLRRFGYEHKQRPFSEYVAFQETLQAAQDAGLSVSDYIERKHPTGGKTPLEITLDGMKRLGVFNEPIQRVCEIGPGSGRYLEKTIAECHPEQYEIYETSEEWKDWLLARNTLMARECDGNSLAETPSESVDLAQAHKVFPGLPTLVTIRYLDEMARVVRSGGWVVFDAMTENCFEGENLRAWLEAKPWDWDWAPKIFPKAYMIRFLQNRGVSLVGSFEVPLFPAITECFVFRRNGGRT